MSLYTLVPIGNFYAAVQLAFLPAHPTLTDQMLNTIAIGYGMRVSGANSFCFLFFFTYITYCAPSGHVGVVSTYGETTAAAST